MSAAERDGRRLGVVVVAAGDGVRLGAGGPKALIEIAGRSLLSYALAGLAAADLPPPVVVHPVGFAGDFAAAAAGLPVAAFVAGGVTRTASVRAGVAALDTDVEVVAIHDAARPLTPPGVMRAAVDVVRGDVLAAAPARPVADTLKRVAQDEILATVDRTALVGVQTPQVFVRWVLDAALAQQGDATDDLTLVEGLVARGDAKGRIVTVTGSLRGHKVTYPEDLALVRAIAEGRL